ncbi:hypothetical protein APUTEX25_002448 [Auxenochlorella protothecoides]|uniref:peptidylprolyl isomerase n=1 Tax=Auxenochlorella protothecoides TaxID=3075 RepID=A0A3M7L0M7_AUXPR|nr:hypothetical protein APUTEX25_002448 [Auxenochlorella protothecoides]|eukprot:RMZ56258.1 hypothetical protein APUTEX25_002448 [Auxenochlorella protothecoides]
MEHRGRTSFWGCVVEAGCSHTFDPPSHSFSKLHLSQAALPTDAKPNSKATLEVKTRDSLARAVVTLRAGKVEHASIDLVIDEQVVFSAVGDADIHLTGYHMPEFEGDDESDLEAAGETVAKQAAQPVAKAPVRAETAKPAKEAKKRTFPNGFEIEVLKQGLPDAKFAKAGKTVSVKYTGRLKSSGKVFDATKGNRAFNFRLGVGEVIKGWDRGVEGMRIGDKRRLIIPPAMAYGTSGAGKAIPPNAWLDFEVELVNVK